MIKISIIIPLFNAQDYIDECIQSILNQSLKEIEVIVIDDGSTDASVEKVMMFKDARLNLIVKKNGGAASARNIGINQAKGKYIGFVDCDDFLLNESALEEMYSLAMNNNSDIVVGNGLMYFDEKKSYPMHRNTEIFVESTLNSENFLILFYQKNCMHSVVWLNIYKSELLINNTYFMEGVGHEDEEFTTRVFLKSEYVTIFPKVFYVYRYREGSITKVKDKTKQSLDLIKICIELEKTYSKISNKTLKKILRNNLVSIFLLACYRSKLIELPINSCNFLLRNNPSLSNLIKIILFCMSKKLYYFVTKMHIKVQE